MMVFNTGVYYVRVHRAQGFTGLMHVALYTVGKECTVLSTGNENVLGHPLWKHCPHSLLVEQHGNSNLPYCYTASLCVILFLFHSTLGGGYCFSSVASSSTSSPPGF